MIEAHALTVALGGRWHGSYGTAPCPLCQPDRRRDQSGLTLTEGRAGLLMHCKRSGCGFRDILAAAGMASGSFSPPDPMMHAQREAERRAEVMKRAAVAERLWREAQPIGGTLAESYLRRRGIWCDLPPTLRFHPDCWHGPSATRWPAMLARVDGSEGFAVHRTWLRPNGVGPDGLGKAPISPAKAMLGATAGGAVRLSDGPSRLVAAEGLESALSLLCGLLDGPASVWAGLSTSGLRGLRLPARPGVLVVATDGDQQGRKAGHALAERAHALGWVVSILDPGNGADFNTILQERAAA